MRKYKIQRSGKGFSIWMLKDFGAGRAWVDFGKRYKTASDAESAIAEMEAKEENEK